MDDSLMNQPISRGDRPLPAAYSESSEKQLMTSVLDAERPRYASNQRETDSSASFQLWRDIPIGVVFNCLNCIIIVRCVFEAILEDHSLAPDWSDYYAMLVAYAHIYISWMCLFATFAVLIATFLKLKLSIAVRMVALFSPLIIAVPFLDYFISRGSEISYGYNFSDFIYNYANLFNPMARITMVSIGVRIEVFAATAGTFLVSCLYFRKSLVRSVAFALSIYSAIFFFGYLPAIMPAIVQRSYLAEFPMYLPVFIVLTALIAGRLWRENRGWGRVVLQLLFPSRLVFYVLLVGLGMVFTAKQSGTYPKIFTNGGIFSLLSATVSVTLLFIYAKIQNDFYDREIDSISNPFRAVIFTAIPPESVRSLKMVFLLPSLVFALGAHRYFLPLWLLILALSALYSEPPMRLRRFYPVGHCVLSLLGVSTFMSGAVLAGSKDFFLVSGVPTMALCVFGGFFFLSHVKDFKDMDGDLHGGVINVYNLTKSPKAIGISVICNFAAILIVVLSMLSIFATTALAAVGIYLVVALTAIKISSDVRRLDWLLPWSFALMLYISLIWLLKITTWPGA